MKRSCCFPTTCLHKLSGGGSSKEKKVFTLFQCNRQNETVVSVGFLKFPVVIITEKDILTFPLGKADCCRPTIKIWDKVCHGLEQGSPISDMAMLVKG